MADRSDHDITHHGDHTFSSDGTLALASGSTMTVQSGATLTVAAGGSLDTSATGGLVHYTFAILFSDLGSGASDLIAATGFPTATRIVDAWLEVDTEGAGEADLACTIGVTADADGYMTTQNLNAVAAGTFLAADGALAVGLYYADAAGSSGLGVTFTATELDDVTAGAWTLHIRHLPITA